MSPIGIGASHSTYTLRTGEAKLWILLVGVNQYQDKSLPSLRYPAVDCKGLGDAMTQAIHNFPNKEVIVHNDFTEKPPTLSQVRNSLGRIVTQAQSRDSVILYFSGHGMLDEDTQQPVLCMADTRKGDLLNTGLVMQELLQLLGSSSAHQQLLCLDTCHSGNVMLLGGNRGLSRDAGASEALINSTPKFMELLRQRAAKSKGFCALLSCDHGQQSWEFPELGHGVFTYYLMQGLLGGAADYQGIIEADGLYKYVYRHTLQYINKLNQQLRLINEHKLRRGDSELYPEYPLQTPKRIVEGVGELVLGFKSHSVQSRVQSSKQRYAFTVDGLGNTKTTTNLARFLGGSGEFEVEYYLDNKSSSNLRASIQQFIQQKGRVQAQINSGSNVSGYNIIQNTPTKLLYLRGKIEEIEEGEAWFVLDSGARLSRSWLRQQLRHSGICKQIIILDCPGANGLESWVEDLQLNSEQAQCLIAAASPIGRPELFSQIIIETLAKSEPFTGLSVAEWITQLQSAVQRTGIKTYTWLSGTRGVIDILPGNISAAFQRSQQLDTQRSEHLRSHSNSHSYPTNTEPPTTVYNGTPIQPNNAKNYDAQAHLSDDTCGKSQIVPKTEASLPEFEKSFTNPTRSFALNGQYYTQIENLLKQFIGPVAVTILENVLPQSRNFQELVGILASFTLPEHRNKFKEQAIAILKHVNSQGLSSNSTNSNNINSNNLGLQNPTSGSANQQNISSPNLSPTNPRSRTSTSRNSTSRNPTSRNSTSRNSTSRNSTSRNLTSHTSNCNPQNKNQNFEIDAKFIHECTRELAYLVGPFANFIIQNILTENQYISALELVNKVAEVIPDPMQAVEFKIKMLEKIK
ncbi:caspase family protein [Mastigocoleus testarum]|uniref:Peptidase C14 n=1 Tax=Mastigocoleus testarum BC008 TaxID=371196 RepID=A0A0V7ZNW5_9CYAN|nr:caspase family protein [Mastigocoleus testarum]KST66120.1 hypothetical protein BC008_24395 [Mastigocoleus testarum BC008]